MIESRVPRSPQHNAPLIPVVTCKHVPKSKSGRAAIGGEPDGAADAHHGHRLHGRQPQLRQRQRPHHQAKEVVEPSFKFEIIYRM